MFGVKFSSSTSSSNWPPKPAASTVSPPNSYEPIERQSKVATNWTIVSGLALGVDSISHDVALKNSGRTIAVLANGLDTIYPKKNQLLAEAILECGGALVSEQPFNTPATPHNLVQRDRLQSGFSVGTVVMQTDVIGGSMHTVRYTLEQGRRLFVAAPPEDQVEEPKSRGVVALANRTGPELLRVIRSTPSYEQLLKTNFVDRPPAVPIRDETDCELMVSLLTQDRNTLLQSSNPRRLAQLHLPV